MRTCAQCQREFRPSSGHLRCPACRSIDRCRCGAPKQRHSRSCINCTSQAGSENGHWKGGKTHHKAGYVMVRVPDHPRASNGYVFEHILVVEATLGRFLTPGETVHHRNGFRSDNRPQNLELWVSSHPAGARIDDVIAWAIEVLTVYQPWALRGGGVVEAAAIEAASETASYETSTSVDRI